MRVLVIGLDGATWRVLDPLIGEGYTPALGELSRGARAVLESTVPPITGAAWPAMATGKNPGKLGIIDHLRRESPESWRLRPVSSADIRGQAVWDYLGMAGHRVGVFNYPLLYPPYPVNGFMVSGLGADESMEYTYPASLKGELDEAAGGYRIYVTHYDKKYWDNVDLLLRDLHDFMDRFERAVLHVASKEWDFLFTVLSATDWIQHAMWMYIDESHPLYDPSEAPRYRRGFAEFWARVDEYVSRLLDAAGDAAVLVVSDHGFGPARAAFNLRRWLVEKGYMRLRGAAPLKRRLLSAAAAVGRRVLPARVKARLRTRVRQELSPAGEVDLEGSRAVCLGHSIEFGAVYIVDRERDAVLRSLLRDLSGLPSEIGVGSVQVYVREETWSGDKLGLLPDLVFELDGGACYVVETRPDLPLYVDYPLSPRLSGGHRMDGVFMARGPGMRRGLDLGRLRIYDVAPTILHLYGLPVPGDMDGRVVEELFEPGSPLARRPRRVDPARYRASLRMRRLRRARKR